MANTRQWRRRDLLKAGGAALSLPYLVPSGVLGAGGKPGANDTVRLAIIGLGGRARSIVKESVDVSGKKIVAVCDCFDPATEAFVRDVGKDQNWNTYADFRQMIEKEKPDGVFVETTTHARAWIVIQAMQMGVDTYIEKPMCLTVAEGRYMAQAAKRYSRVTQVGTQQRSMPLNNWASDLVKNGALGKIKTVLAPNFVGPAYWDNKPAQPLPAGGSDNWWDIWTNQAIERPYHAQLHHGWERWWDYDGGGLCYGVTGWGTHSYDQLQRALGTDYTCPVEMVLEEPIKNESCGKFAVLDPDETRLDYLIKLAERVEGPRAKIRMWYADGTELRLHLDGEWGPGLGAIFIGEKGKMEINRDKIAANPKELMQSADNPGPAQKPETHYHIENFVNCIKSREKCNADIEIGLHSTTLCYLVNIVRQVGRVNERLRWDPAAERFTNCEEGNRLLSRERRKGYELPELV